MKFAIWFLGTLSALIILHSCEGVSNARTAPTYKMYVFLSAFRVTEAQKKSIQRLYSRGAKAIVWV